MLAARNLASMTRASEWAERVEAWRSSGKSAGDYCSGRDYSAKTLQWWASRLRRKKVQAAAQVSEVSVAAARPATSDVATVRMARVVRGLASTSASAVVVQFGSARVEISSGVDRATLALVFEALGVAAGGSR